MKRALSRIAVWGVLICAGAPRSSAAQSCQLFAAALETVGAEPGTALLVDHTSLGVPRFAFNAYSSFERGDTVLARVIDPALRKANATPIPVPSCLADSLNWHTIADSVLFRIFRPPGDRWANFRQLFPTTPRFALLSRPVLSGDTATMYVAMASDRLSGVGKIVQFVRDGSGRWVKRAEVQVWIS